MQGKKIKTGRINDGLPMQLMTNLDNTNLTS